MLGPSLRMQKKLEYPPALGPTHGTMRKRHRTLTAKRQHEHNLSKFKQPLSSSSRWSQVLKYPPGLFLLWTTWNQFKYWFNQARQFIVPTWLEKCWRGVVHQSKQTKCFACHKHLLGGLLGKSTEEHMLN